MTSHLSYLGNKFLVYLKSCSFRLIICDLKPNEQPNVTWNTSGTIIECYIAYNISSLVWHLREKNGYRIFNLFPERKGTV